MNTVTLESALQLVREAVETARRLGVNGVSVVVLDQTAAIRAAVRTDLANLFGIEIARAKAMSAFAFKSTTLAQSETFGKNPVLVTAVAAATEGKFMPIGGGAPIYDAEGVLVGAAAVSGSSPDNDDQIVRAAIAASGLSIVPVISPVLAPSPRK